MIWTALWSIGGLLLAVPAFGILRDLRHQFKEGSSSRTGGSLLHPFLCLLLLGGMVYAAIAHQYLLIIPGLVAFFFLDGFIYWGWTPREKPNKGQETVRRGTRVVDATHRTRKSVDDRAIQIGGVEIPKSLEAQHILIAGTTGAGKTQIINGMLRTIRKRGQRAVIADPAGGFYARLGQSGDKLLNPFDQRSVSWSPFA